jgi:hypothetical protein
VEKVIAKGEPLPKFDMHARLMTLPGILDSTPEDVPAEVPYLRVEEKRVERIRKLLRRGDGAIGGNGDGKNGHREKKSFNVGLVWQGNTAHKGDRFRSIALSKFAPLAQIEGVRLVSLQKGFGTEQIEKHRDELKLLEWSDASDTTAEALLDTAAMMKCLDLVIAVDTSVAHLAGALGVPVWVAMPLASDWRWLLDREDTPWYPTMRLFRQRGLGEWDEVIARIRTALEERVSGRLPPETAAPQVMISITSGELIDRLTALEAAHIHSNGNGVNGDAAAELARLSQTAKSFFFSPEIELLAAELRELHQAACRTDWDMAQCAAASDFGKGFVELFETAARLRDQRLKIRSRIDELTRATVK